MRNNISVTSNPNIQTLVGEVVRGEHSKDHLPNAAFDFSGEAQAIYFSNARRNLQSIVSYAVMTLKPRTPELGVLSLVRRQHNG